MVARLIRDESDLTEWDPSIAVRGEHVFAGVDSDGTEFEVRIPIISFAAGGDSGSGGSSSAEGSFNIFALRQDMVKDALKGVIDSLRKGGRGVFNDISITELEQVIDNPPRAISNIEYQRVLLDLARLIESSDERSEVLAQLLGERLGLPNDPESREDPERPPDLTARRAEAERLDRERLLDVRNDPDAVKGVVKRMLSDIRVTLASEIEGVDDLLLPLETLLDADDYIDPAYRFQIFQRLFMTFAALYKLLRLPDSHIHAEPIARQFRYILGDIASLPHADVRDPQLNLTGDMNQDRIILAEYFLRCSVFILNYEVAEGAESDVSPFAMRWLLAIQVVNITIADGVLLDGIYILKEEADLDDWTVATLEGLHQIYYFGLLGNNRLTLKDTRELWDTTRDLVLAIEEVVTVHSSGDVSAWNGLAAQVNRRYVSVRDDYLGGSEEVHAEGITDLREARYIGLGSGGIDSNETAHLIRLLLATEMLTADGLDGNLLQSIGNMSEIAGEARYLLEIRSPTDAVEAFFTDSANDLIPSQFLEAALLLAAYAMRFEDGSERSQRAFNVVYPELIRLAARPIFEGDVYQVATRRLIAHGFKERFRSHVDKVAGEIAVALEVTDTGHAYSPRFFDTMSSVLSGVTIPPVFFLTPHARSRISGEGDVVKPEAQVAALPSFVSAFASAGGQLNVSHFFISASREWLQISAFLTALISVDSGGIINFIYIDGDIPSKRLLDLASGLGAKIFSRLKMGEIPEIGELPARDVYHLGIRVPDLGGDSDARYMEWSERHADLKAFALKVIRESLGDSASDLESGFDHFVREIYDRHGARAVEGMLFDMIYVDSAVRGQIKLAGEEELPEVAAVFQDRIYRAYLDVLMNPDNLGYVPGIARMMRYFAERNALPTTITLLELMNRGGEEGVRVVLDLYTRDERLMAEDYLGVMIDSFSDQDEDGPYERLAMRGILFAMIVDTGYRREDMAVEEADFDTFRRYLEPLSPDLFLGVQDWGMAYRLYKIGKSWLDREAE